MKKIIALVIVLVLLPVMLLSSLWYIPKSETLEGYEDATVYYRGLVFPGTDGPFSKHYFKIAMPWSEWHYTIDFDGEGYNEFEATYPNGSIAATGTCIVQITGFRDQPFPDPDNVDDATYYLPDGNIASKVESGTGTITVWTPDGTKVWEIELIEHVRQVLRAWYENGQLIQERHYVNGELHGPFTIYYENGNKKTVGEYNHGEWVGVWIRYDENGKEIEREIKELDDL